MTITIDANLQIELINDTHAQQIFDMVDNNRNHLRPWLPFVDRMQTLTFAQNFVNGTIQRNKDGNEYAFVIFYGDIMVGRVGVYKIDKQNKIGEIGYWIIEAAQGKGIITKSCQAVIDYCFNVLNLNRIEIKCGTENYKSKLIPEKLNFTFEGIMRQGELLHEEFIDLDLYSLLREDLFDNNELFNISPQ